MLKQIKALLDGDLIKSNFFDLNSLIEKSNEKKIHLSEKNWNLLWFLAYQKLTLVVEEVNQQITKQKSWEQLEEEFGIFYASEIMNPVSVDAALPLDSYSSSTLGFYTSREVDLKNFNKPTELVSLPGIIKISNLKDIFKEKYIAYDLLSSILKATEIIQKFEEQKKSYNFCINLDHSTQWGHDERLHNILHIHKGKEGILKVERKRLYKYDEYGVPFLCKK